ncbi:MAG: hypothetical protein BRD57_03175 [Proteobacteria bacterium SW_6_67_9]|nr:MAG: hypothetical protein BRD57_03175 [Proteobacteria bacterium SW_6_67_9]
MIPRELELVQVVCIVGNGRGGARIRLANGRVECDGVTTVVGLRRRLGCVRGGLLRWRLDHHLLILAIGRGLATGLQCRDGPRGALE